MSARIPPGYAEASVQFRLASDPEPMLVSLGLALAIGVTPDVAVTNEIIDLMGDQFRLFVCDDYTIGAGWVTFGQDGPDDIRVDGTQNPQNGSIVSDPLPNNGALLVRKLTALGGRRHRGRMFVPGIASGVVSGNGNVATATVNVAQAAMNTMLTGLTGLASLTGAALLHNSAPFNPTEISSFVVVPKIATQRRRLRP